jgi:uncharacterized protein (DUF1800 family)
MDQTSLQQRIALNRFGLGRRRDEPLPANPKAWLTGQLSGFDPRPAAMANAPQMASVAGQLADYFAELRAAGGRPAQKAAIQNAAAQAGAMRAAMPAGMPAAPVPGLAEKTAGLPDATRKFIQQAARDYYLSAVAARANAALTTPAPFVERLVHFWSNHFAVSADKLVVIGLAGLLELEAIRPHVLGRFSDMLLAVERHPAMLLYLDQAQSVGPNSMIGTRAAAFARRKIGLNENLAREIMELHTLGVRSGYTQADVTEFARALTGWTVNGLAQGPGARIVGTSGGAGTFHFAERLHEPGGRTIVGRSYAAGGEEQARAVLMDLAASPATARHLATKLTRHFAGDEPPPAMVERLTQAYLKSGGDLPTVYRAIVDSPEAWAPQPVKFKTPWDWALSSLRAVGTREVQGQAVAGLMNQLGQPVWRPGSPAGYDDIAASWAGPNAVLRRVEVAARLAGRAASPVDPRSLANDLVPGGVAPATAQAIARAESPAQGLALLLVAPEFMRR